MKKLFSIILFTTFFSSGIFAQSRVFVSASTAIGFNNKSINVWKYEFDTSPSFGYLLGASYQYYYQEKYFVKTGLYFQQSFAKFEVNNIKAQGTSYNVVMPIEIGIKFLDNYEISSGISLKNYRDVSEFDINSSSNIRTNFIISGSYWINDKWRAELAFSKMISEQVPSLVVSSYISHFSLGINYYIF